MAGALGALTNGKRRKMRRADFLLLLTYLPLSAPIVCYTCTGDNESSCLTTSSWVQEDCAPTDDRCYLLSRSTSDLRPARMGCAYNKESCGDKEEEKLCTLCKGDRCNGAEAEKYWTAREPISTTPNATNALTFNIVLLIFCLIKSYFGTTFLRK